MEKKKKRRGSNSKIADSIERRRSHTCWKVAAPPSTAAFLKQKCPISKAILATDMMIVGKNRG